MQTSPYHRHQARLWGGGWGAGVVILGMALAMVVVGQETRPAQGVAAEATVRFGYVDVYIDSGDHLLAVWQFEFKTLAGNVQLVGIEGGDAKGFHEPPYYDPAALALDRVVVGSFSTAVNLPAGRTRVARLSVRIEGQQRPAYAVTVMAAGNRDGVAIPATASFVEGAAQ